MDQPSAPVLAPSHSPEGTLFYLVGGSGEGKARLLDYARARLGDNHLVVFAHRYIMRGSDRGREDEIRLSNAEFALRKRHGLFVMSWESDGLTYGVGTEINYWLARGLSVAVKGSRAYLGQALMAYPDMTVIWVTADEKMAAQRTPRRARGFQPESIEEGAHMSCGRSRTLGSRVVHICSNGTLSLAGEKLVSVLAGNAD